MNIAPQGPRFEAPFLLNDALSLIADALEERNVCSAKIPQALYGSILYQRHEIEGRNRGQVPLHVREYDKVLVREEDLVLLRDPPKDVVNPTNGCDW